VSFYGLLPPCRTLTFPQKNETVEIAANFHGFYFLQDDAG
jgi:hypothetical protein